MKKEWLDRLSDVDPIYIEEADPSLEPPTVIRSARSFRFALLAAAMALLILTVTATFSLLLSQRQPSDTPMTTEESDTAIVGEGFLPMQTEKDPAVNTPAPIPDRLLVSAADPAYRKLARLIYHYSMNEAPLFGTSGGSRPDDSLSSPGPSLTPPEEPVPGGNQSENPGSQGNPKPDNGNFGATDGSADGMIESDICRRTSTHIFYLNGDRLRIYSIKGTDSILTATLDLAMEQRMTDYQAVRLPCELFLSEDGHRLTILCTYGTHLATENTAVISVDVSDPASPFVHNTYVVAGRFVSARLIEGDIILFTAHGISLNNMDFRVPETYLPYYRRHTDTDTVLLPPSDIHVPATVSAGRYVVFSRLSEADVTPLFVCAYLSYSETVYIAKDRFFLFQITGVAEDRYFEPVTDILSVRFGDSTSDSDGNSSSSGNKPLIEGTCRVKGYMESIHCVELRGHMLRVVTTTDRVTASRPAEREEDWIGVESSPYSSVAVSCISVEDRQLLGKAESIVPQGERVYSVRFEEEAVHIRTARRGADSQAQAVYICDLSDPERITHRNGGTPEGDVHALVDFGEDFLLGIGEGEGGGFALRIYGKEEAYGEPVAVYTDSALDFSRAYRSYYIDPSRRLIGFLLNGDYVLLTFDGTAFSEYRRIRPALTDGEDQPNGRLDPTMARAMLIDGYLYILCNDCFSVERMVDAVG